jgi:hypothetical protein
MEPIKKVDFSSILDKAALDRERAEKQRRERGEKEKSRTEKKQAEERTPKKPDHTFAENRIDFRIFENPGEGGRPDWKIEFVRLYSYGERQGEAKSFRPGDVADIVRGLYRARKWIHEQEWRRGLRSWWRQWW